MVLSVHHLQTMYLLETYHVLQELNSMFEEADLRIVSHVNWAVQNGAKRVVVLSNDTDAAHLLLHFMSHWKIAGFTCGYSLEQEKSSLYSCS